MNGLVQDLRYALRQLRRSPGFASVVIRESFAADPHRDGGLAPAKGWNEEGWSEASRASTAGWNAWTG